MILERQTNVEVLESGETSESIQMELDLDSAQFLMQMLSKTLYSDSIGSICRELSSNALDSHRRAKIDKPIIVSFKSNNDGNYEFSVEDFGGSLDDNDVREIISKYGKSTKRDSIDELGLYGIGFKSPLSYSSSFYFICRKDGTERKYMMYEGEEFNTIDLLYESPTDENNGVKVIVPVKYSDRNEFIEKIKEQLAYFENVYFDVPQCKTSNGYYSNSYTDGIDNNFLIHRTEHFQFSELITTKELHICLDNVFYPIDFEKLGISEIDIPIGLRFNLTDGIYPTINRETIRYTKEAKEIILNKIAIVADVLVIKYNESISEISDINTIFEYYGNSSRNITIDGKTIDINSIIKFSYIPLAIPTLIGVSLLNLKELYEIRNILVKNYVEKFTIKNGTIKTTKYNSDLDFRDIISNNIYVFNETFNNLKKEYIKSVSNYNKKYKIVGKTKDYTLGWNTRKYASYNSQQRTYYFFLKLENYPKSQWRQIIKEFQYVQSLITDNFVDIDSLVIPQEWIDARKQQRVITGKINGGRRIKLTGEVFGKIGTNLERAVSGQNCKFVPETFKLEDVHKYKGLTVYDNYDNQSELDNLYYISKIRVLSFSNRELKILNTLQIHNLISYKTFMEGDNKPFKRLITAYLIKQLILKYRNVFDNSNRLETISVGLVNKLKELDNYKNSNYRHSFDEVYEAMLVVANENNLFDITIYSTYLEIKTLLEKLTFLEPIMNKMSSYNNEDDLISILVDLFKYYKHRIDYKNYHCSLNNPLDLEELLLTDETVEELIEI